MIPEMIAIALAIVGTIECVIRLSVIHCFRLMLEIGQRVPKFLRRRASEHLKEKASRLFSIKLFFASSRCLLLIFLSSLPIFLILTVDNLTAGQILYPLDSLKIRFGMVGFGILYATFRRQLWQLT
jgi:hypothetical protein